MSTLQKSLYNLLPDNGTLRSWRLPLVALLIVAAAGLLGWWSSALPLVALLAVDGAVLVLLYPPLGLLALIATALLEPLAIGTGTEVNLNPTIVLLPMLMAAVALQIVLKGGYKLPRRETVLPLGLFILAAAVSLPIGLAIWDPGVPRRDNFLLVQLAQWAIYALSAGAYWLAAVVFVEKRWLRRATWLFLIIGGLIALVSALPGGGQFLVENVSGAISRAPFWLVLASLTGGQLFFNQRLKRSQRIAMGLLMTVILVSAFIVRRESVSTWLSVAAALAVLSWLRWRRLRWIALVALFLLLLTGILLSTVWNFAGGQEEWVESGGSRLVLIERVLSVTAHNPLSGLGPAAYRLYAGMEPLAYRNAFWTTPSISSHNNYVDVLAQFGIVGLGLLAWFAVAVTRVGLRLSRRLPDGFEAGYVNGVLAMGGGALLLMMLADWILPFVYNIGFPGFQTSVLFWLFLGGLLAVERLSDPAQQSG
ncbi:MAG: O-antigen ligase family protein [Candidatus Promineifilaceae bacterium]|nr:O-antigen ligase family protein [Candidatus Promineifilaceae bacterium]